MQHEGKDASDVNRFRRERNGARIMFPDLAGFWAEHRSLMAGGLFKRRPGSRIIGFKERGPRKNSV